MTPVRCLEAQRLVSDLRMELPLDAAETKGAEAVLKQRVWAWVRAAMRGHDTTWLHDGKQRRATLRCDAGLRSLTLLAKQRELRVPLSGIAAVAPAEPEDPEVDEGCALCVQLTQQGQQKGSSSCASWVLVEPDEEKRDACLEALRVLTAQA